MFSINFSELWARYGVGTMIPSGNSDFWNFIYVTNLQLVCVKIPIMLSRFIQNICNSNIRNAISLFYSLWLQILKHFCVISIYFPGFIAILETKYLRMGQLKFVENNLEKYVCFVHFSQMFHFYTSWEC